MANLNLLDLEESGVSYGIEGLKILIEEDRKKGN